MVGEGPLFEVMRLVEEARDDPERFSNVGAKETTTALRRGLRKVMDEVYAKGWDAGYAAALVDEAVGQEAAREAERRSAPHGTQA